MSSTGFRVATEELFIVQFVKQLKTYMEKETMKKYLIMLFSIALVISACSAPNTQQATEQPQPTKPSQSTQEPPASLIGPWQLTAYGSASAPTLAIEGAAAGLTFNEDGTVSGSSGCNGMGGDYTVEGDQISFGEFVSTLMACDPPIMEQEDAAHKVLSGTATYKIEDDTLTITNNDLVLVLTRGNYGSAEPASSASLTGPWTLTSYGTTETISSALTDVEANLTFKEDGTVTGTSGCNEFGGKYAVEGNQIKFTEIVSTLMLCDTPVMGQEEAMQQVLTESATYQIEGNTLTLSNHDRILVLTR
jgi:heat shock protein HslJ